MPQSWHFLGPVTRFQDRSKPVTYEIAQIKLIVENQNPESVGVSTEGIVVYPEDEVHLSITCTFPQLTLSRLSKSGVI